MIHKLHANFSQNEDDSLASLWESYLNKYGKLLCMIAYRISGDPVLCSHEENMADLYCSSWESILAWKRKFPNQTDLELMEDRNFDKYTKTCLWNAKNKKGSLISKKINLYTKKISLEINSSV